MQTRHEKIFPAVLAKLKSLTEKALEVDEVPIACVLFSDEEIIAGHFNETRLSHNSTKHAEVMCIDSGCQVTGNERLGGLGLLTTLEPCLMCSGAIVEARLDVVYYICPSTRGPSLSDLYTPTFKDNFKKDKGINHYPQLLQLVDYTEEYSQILKHFFQKKRKS